METRREVPPRPAHGHPPGFELTDGRSAAPRREARE